MLQREKETKAILRIPTLYFKYAEHVRKLKGMRDTYYERVRHTGIDKAYVTRHVPLFKELDEIVQVREQSEHYTEDNIQGFDEIKEQIKIAE